MAISYDLGSYPLWNIINNEGFPAGGAKIYTYSSLDHDQLKATYQDPGGIVPNANPIVCQFNGVAPNPIYFKFDSAAPDELYFIRVTDSENNLLWTIDNYQGGGSGGGGGSVTVYSMTENLIANSFFIDHIEDTANPVNSNDLVIAPGAHKGFTPSNNGLSLIGTNGALGGDIRFIKNGSGDADQITFVNFGLGTDPLANQPTPPQYINYDCNNIPTAQTFKAFQFPICQKVKNLSNSIVTFTVWAKCTTGTDTLTADFRQYFGSGTAASSEVLTPIDTGTISVTDTWTRFDLTATVPSVTGKSLGTTGQQTGDDALYIQLGMPVGQACSIQFCIPQLYLGAVTVPSYFETYDELNSLNQTPRTGDVKPGYSTTAPRGWLVMNDQTIGNVGSGAAYAAENCFNLYVTVYLGVSNTYAPVSGGRSGSGISNAIADFIAGKTLTLPRSLGRALAHSGTGASSAPNAVLTAHGLGEWTGSETHVLSIAEMPAHDHSYNHVLHDGNLVLNLGGDVRLNGSDTTGSRGGGGAHTSVQPTTYMQFYIKL